MARIFSAGKRTGQTEPVLRNTGPQPVGSFLNGLTKPAFEKFGFPAAALLTDWPAIAGPDIAAFSAPERLKWPQRREGALGDEKLKQGATLILRVCGPRAIELQHQTSQLLERINSYFGFSAVSNIRILQVPMEHCGATGSPKPARTKRTARAKSAADLRGIRDERLRRALSRMAAAVGA